MGPPPLHPGEGMRNCHDKVMPQQFLEKYKGERKDSKKTNKTFTGGTKSGSWKDQMRI